MKKVLALALLSIVLLQSGGLLFLQQMNQEFHKSKMQLVLENSSSGFEKLTLDLATYNACKLDEKEILYKGDMYDVKSIHKSGNTVELLVIQDSKENELKHKIKETAQQLNESDKNPNPRIIDLFHLVYICPETILVSPGIQMNQLAFLPFKPCTQLLVCEIPSPPPRIV